MNVWDEFTRPYERPEPCPVDHSQLFEYGIVIASNGRHHIKRWCSECKQVFGGAIGHAFFTERERETYPVVRDNRDESRARCEVCDDADVEWHHFAPHYLFGAESDDWPGAYLCPNCHQRWHKIVTPDMHRRAR